jgi:hypothetical protein
MEQVIAQLRAVPEVQQDELARFFLNQLQDEQRWTRSTAMHDATDRA